MKLATITPRAANAAPTAVMPSTIGLADSSARADLTAVMAFITPVIAINTGPIAATISAAIKMPRFVLSDKLSTHDTTSLSEETIDVIAGSSNLPNDVAVCFMFSPSLRVWLANELPVRTKSPCAFVVIAMT